MELETYGIDPLRGFLPPYNPVQMSGHLKFDSTVGATALNMPKMLLNANLRGFIESLPEFDMSELIPELGPRRAAEVMRCYSFIAHAYVWGLGQTRHILPKNIARPFAQIAEHLGRPPVLSYDSYTLNNWYLLDGNLPIQLGNIALIQNFLGGLDEEWFILIHIAIEAHAAPAIAAIPQLLAAAEQGDGVSVRVGLEVVALAMAEIRTTMDKMADHCDPSIYYQRVRPYIHGWKNNPALPDGLIYEGVNDQPRFYRGETGAQSTIIPVLDGLLGIVHEEDEMRDYLMEMRDYMPPDHCQFLNDVEDQSRVRAFVQSQDDAELHAVYNACVDHVAQFRTQHMKFAASYIHNQAERGDNPVHVGTGGTPFMTYLKKHRDESSKHLIEE